MRMTGDPSNQYQRWFDIVDLSGRSVPKSQYGRVRSGWRACLARNAGERRNLKGGEVVPRQATTQIESGAVRSSESAEAPPTQDTFRPSVLALVLSLNIFSAYIWLGAAAVVMVLGFPIIGGFMRRGYAAKIFMTQFASLFVREFERPLLQEAAEPAMRAHLRVRPYRARLEICLAPGNGRRYPNLSDHRTNVEYDVDRVLSALADESFVCGRLRMRKGWVIVPFRFSARLKQRGVRCISSL
jgi:hypothetical protein